MRKSTFILAGLASAAMVAAFATPSLASSATSNSGHAPALNPGHVVIHSSSPQGKKFKAFAQPSKKYTKGSCDIDLSGIADGTSLNSVDGCDTTITLGGSAWEKVSVPNYWGSWNCPPATESCTPNALFATGQTTGSTVNFGKKVKVGGFELEPDQFLAETFEVDFYAKPNGKGKLRGTITLTPNGQSGALLYGAKSKKPFQSAVISTDAGDDFAIAQVRV